MNQLRRNNRKHMRLKGYDYSQAGLYFITICTKNREHIFGIINNGVIILNEYGDIVRNYWNDIPNHYINVELDEYIIMPDHFHGIIQMNPSVAQFIASNSVASNIAMKQEDAMNRTPTAVTIGAVVRSFKACCTHAINKMNNNIGVSIWQRNYYERIIRNEKSYYQISEYIKSNPKNWQDDKHIK